jgi:hypothetical protein
VQSTEHAETLANFIKQNHPAKGEEKGRTKRKDRSPNQKLKKPKGGHKWAKQQIMFQSLHQLQEAYQRKKWEKNLKAQSD